MESESSHGILRDCVDKGFSLVVTEAYSFEINQIVEGTKIITWKICIVI